ncbi:GL15441 [Drosophila persimilis]|uniref:GL15441 n=1 Tax=Drosophila persimilis TaxID=7234 RepID=B4HBY7_DROPE|nr:GL15441 [Drosophila persimilis]
MAARAGRLEKHIYFLSATLFLPVHQVDDAAAGAGAAPACRFKDNDIEVKRKDGIILLRELAAEVKNFMDFKRNAVMWLNR